MQNNPCFNGGKCVEMVETEEVPFYHFACICRDGYEGYFCETGKSRFLVFKSTVVSFGLPANLKRLWTYTTVSKVIEHWPSQFLRQLIMSETTEQVSTWPKSVGKF